MIVSSNSTLLQTMNASKSSKTYIESQNISSSTSIPKEVIEKENEEGNIRYKHLAKNGLFKNSAFERDEKLKGEFVDYLSSMEDKDFMDFSTKLWSSFHSGLTQDENGNVISMSSLNTNGYKEFDNINSISDYLKEEIRNLVNGAKKYGGDVSGMVDVLTDVLNFFRSYESKEQENQYLSLGKAY